MPVLMRKLLEDVVQSFFHCQEQIVSDFRRDWIEITSQPIHGVIVWIGSPDHFVKELHGGGRTSRLHRARKKMLRT